MLSGNPRVDLKNSDPEIAIRSLSPSRVASMFDRHIQFCVE